MWMNDINMWGKIQKGKGTKREEICKGSKKLSVSTFAVKRALRETVVCCSKDKTNSCQISPRKVKCLAPFLFQPSLERLLMTRQLIKPRGNNSGCNRGRKKILRVPIASSVGHWDIYAKINELKELKEQAETISQPLANLLENSCKICRARKVKNNQQTTYLHEGIREETGNYQTDNLTWFLGKYWNK